MNSGGLVANSSKRAIRSKSPQTFQGISLSWVVFLTWTLILLAARSPWPQILSNGFWITLALLIPAILWYKSQPEDGTSPFRTPGPLPQGIPHIWLLPILGGILARWLLSLVPGHWPVLDEGIGGFFAQRLAEHWEGGLVEGATHQPRLFTWGQGLWFSLFGASLVAERTYTAVLSGVGFLGLVAALRRWLSPSAALGGVFLAAFGFWPLWVGSFAVAGVLLVLWVSWLLWLFGVYRDLGPKSPHRVKVSGFLGLWIGLGFYSYLAWPLLALGFLGIFVGAIPLAKRNKNEILWFALWLCLPAVPLLMDAIQGGLPQPYHHLWNGSGTGLGIPLSGNYLRELWIGFPAEDFNFGTLRGGLLNPLVGSLCLLGYLAWLKRASRDRFAMGLWILAPLLLLPGELTNNLEVMRIAHFMPWTVLLGAVGLWELQKGLPKRWGIPILTVLLMGSCGIDLNSAFRGAGWEGNRLTPRPSMHQSPEREEAYRILKARSRTEGPGLIFLDLVADPTNQTLTLATQPFNALRQSDGGAAPSSWAAVFGNIHDAAAIAQRFPGSELHNLSRSGDYPDGGWGLVLFPVKPAERATLARWAKAEQSLERVVRDAVDRGVALDQTQILARLDECKFLFSKDQDLEAFWARIRMVHECAAGDFTEGLRALQAVQGNPRADLMNYQGRLLFALGKPLEARHAFEVALKCRPNWTNAQENLLKLGGQPAGSTQQ